jgi:hypothetical protein
MFYFIVRRKKITFYQFRSSHMKSIYVRRGLCAISTLLMTLSFLDWSAAASTDLVYLTCNRIPSSPQYPSTYYLTIDYSRKTVVTSEVNDTKPMVDAQGRTSQPAQITDSKIVWQIATRRALGDICVEHFTLNRLNGNLSYYDDGTHHGESWSCEIGAKPAPKF